VVPITAAIVMSVVTIVAGRAQGAAADDEQHITHGELKRLVKDANKPADYERLATFYHSREEVYRAKAQAKMDDYASCVRNYLIAPKFPTRADQDFRLFEYYSYKADEQAKLAVRYDDMLLASGVRPFHSAHVISIKDLQSPPPSQGANSALVPTSPSVPQTSKPR
jgi:hypothetical protein